MSSIKSKSKPPLYSPEWFRQNYQVRSGAPKPVRNYQTWGLDWRDQH